MTSTLRSRECERPREAVRPSSFKFVVTSVRDAFSAGASAHNKAQATEMPVENKTTFVSNLNPTAFKTSLKPKFARTNSIPERAIRSPNPPPAKAINSPSVSNCRTIRRRPAPREMRTASSFRRAAARASSRPETLAQAIIRTNPTVVMITARPPRMPKP